MRRNRKYIPSELKQDLKKNQWKIFVSGDYGLRIGGTMFKTNFLILTTFDIFNQIRPDDKESKISVIENYNFKAKVVDRLNQKCQYYRL